MGKTHIYCNCFAKCPNHSSILISLWANIHFVTMKKNAVVHCGKLIIIIKYYRLSHDVVTSDVSRDVSTAYC